MLGARKTLIAVAAAVAGAGLLSASAPVGAYAAHEGDIGSSVGPSSSWASLGPANLAGSAYCLAFEPGPHGAVFVGASGGGIWKSNDDGASWIPLGDALPSLAVSAICVVPRNPRIILAGTGNAVLGNDWIHGVGILRSTDGGRTWARTSEVKDVYSRRNGYHAIEANPGTGVILTAGVDALLRSTDDGATWKRVGSAGNWTDVKWRPGSSDSAYAIKEFDGVYLSSNEGRSFKRLRAGLPADSAVSGQCRIAVSPSDPTRVYASFAYRTGATSGLYRSEDGGETWFPRWSRGNFILGYDWSAVLAVSPRDSQDLIAGCIVPGRSVDGGLTWTEAWDDPRHEMNAVAWRPGSASEVWLATETGVYKSSDGGETWEERSRGLVTLEIYHVCSARGTRSLAYAGTQGQGTVRYVGSPQWEAPDLSHMAPWDDGMICRCDPRDPRVLYGESQYGSHWMSRDGLATVRLLWDGLDGKGRFVAPMDLDPSGSGWRFTATNAGIFRMPDGGSRWERVGEGKDIVSISVSPVSGNWVWALERSSGLVRRSSDGGTTWASFQAAPFALIAGTTILADPADSLGAFCAFRHHPRYPPVVLRTRDGGKTWKDVSGNLQGKSVNTLAVDPSHPEEWYAGTQVGVWRNRDGGHFWTKCGEGLPNAAVMDLEVVDAPRLLRPATLGRGLWELQLQP